MKRSIVTLSIGLCGGNYGPCFDILMFARMVNLKRKKTVSLNFIFTKSQVNH